VGAALTGRAAAARAYGAVRALAFALALPVAGMAMALDANTATQAQLETIRGIGPALSARILEARTRQPFRDLDDLKARVRGIGDANLQRMRQAGLSVGNAGQVQTFVGKPAAAPAGKAVTACKAEVPAAGAAFATGASPTAGAAPPTAGTAPAAGKVAGRARRCTRDG